MTGHPAPGAVADVFDRDTAGAISAIRQALAERMEPRLDELAHVMVSLCREEIPAYAAVDDPATSEELVRINRANVAAVLRGLADDAPLDGEAIAMQRSVGKRSAVLGFPLHATMRAYHVGARVIWPALFEEFLKVPMDAPVAATAARQMGMHALELVGELCATVSEAYLDAEGELRAAAQRLRRDLFEELLAGPFDSNEPLRQRAERAGYRLGEEHLVAIVACGSEHASSGRGCADPAQLAHMAEALRRPLGGAGAGLAEPRSHEVVAIVPKAPAVEEEEVRGGLEQALEATGWRAAGCLLGLGPVHCGIAGIPRSYRQAVMALDAARALGRTGEAVSYLEMLPFLTLMESPGLGTDVWEATIGPLARSDAEDGTDLVATLSAYLEDRCNVVAAAKRLHMHRHTLAARLERIESLSGRTLKSSDDLVLFELGLRAHRLPGTRHRH